MTGYNIFPMEDGEGTGVLSDPEVIASEIIERKKFLVVFLMIAGSRVTAGELKRAEVLMLEETGDGGVRVVSKKIGRGFVDRILRKLRDLNLVDYQRGIDYRRRYYMLSPFGEEVMEKVVEVIKKSLRPHMKRAESVGLDEHYGSYVLEKERFEPLVIDLFGVSPRLIAGVLGIAVVSEGGGTYYVMPWR